MLPDGDAGVAPPLLVTAEVPTGFVVVQVRVEEVQLLAPDGIIQDEVEGVSVPDIWEKVMVTVQLEEIAAVT